MTQKEFKERFSKAHAEWAVEDNYTNLEDVICPLVEQYAIEKALISFGSSTSEINALKAEIIIHKRQIKHLRDGINGVLERISKGLKTGATNGLLLSYHEVLSKLLSDNTDWMGRPLTPPQQIEEPGPVDLPHVGVLCDEDGCEQPAVGRYGGGEYCQYHLDQNNDYFDENYR